MYTDYKMNTRSKDAIVKRKKAILKALEKEYGNITYAAKVVGISAKTIHNYYNSDPDFAEAMDEIRLSVKEQVATSLIKKAVEKDDTLAQIFYLKTQAGWSEKQKIEVTGKQELIQIVPSWIEEAEEVETKTIEQSLDEEKE